MLATGGGAGGRLSETKVWDMKGRELASLAGPTWWVEGVAFAPDGRTLVGSGGTAGGPFQVNVSVWDLPTETSRRVLRGHTAGLTCGAFSPDGKLLATGSSDKTIKLWDVATGAEKATLTNHEDVIRCLAFSPDGMTLGSASTDRTVRLWDVALAKEKAVLLRSKLGATGVAFSADGKLIATSAGDDRNVNLPGEIHLWDAETLRERPNFEGVTHSALSVAFAPDGKRLASGSPGRPALKVWDVATGKLATAVQAATSVRHLAFSPDGKTLATGHGAGGQRGNGSVQLWDTATWKERAALQGHQQLCVTVAFDRSGRFVASASMDGTAKLWPVPPIKTTTAKRP
jgi:WD40 repeat protein